MQAQVMSAAELAIYARVNGVSSADIRKALWKDHALVKTWAMRGTLHLLSSRDLPLYVAARSAYMGRNWLKYFTYYGITPAQYEAFIEAVPEVLGKEPMTREELATSVSEHINVPALSRLLLSSSWGSLWKPSALRGDLCFGPNYGRNVTFVNPRKILKWKHMDPYKALQEIARRYLNAYGPSTPELFARWWELGIAHARELFHSIEDELEIVSVEGWKAFALKESVDAMENIHLPYTVRLLPLFDAYTLGLSRGSELEPLLHRKYHNLVYRPQGWISAVVLVNGYIRGVWEHKVNSQTMVNVRMFSPIKKGVKAEVERLSTFFNTETTLEFRNG